MIIKIIASILIVLVIASVGLAAYTIAKPFDGSINSKGKVNNFETCVRLTGISTDNIPSECIYNGVTYIDGKKNAVKVYDFDNCVAAGYPVQETAPPRCIDSQGTVFIQQQP